MGLHFSYRQGSNLIYIKRITRNQKKEAGFYEDLSYPLSQSVKDTLIMPNICLYFKKEVKLLCELPETSERFKKISSLIYFIGVDCFVLATLKKFPFPVVVGFPYNSWTPELMRNYIRLFFHMGKKEEFRQKHNQKLPPLNSIRNCLNSHPEYYKLDVSSIEILDFYLSNKNNLFLCYNSDKLEDALPNHKITFSAKTKSYDLTSFFNTARDATTSTDKLGRQKQPVYLINTDTISLKSYYNKLKDIPFMQIFLINDFYDFSKIIIEKIHFEKKKKKNSNTQSTAKEYEKAFSNIIKTFYEIEKKI